jgi:GT2 family glycosyltransferase
VSPAAPRVSVVIPAYNRLDLLRPVLEAFARQRTHEPFEIVIADDGSAPPAATVVEAVERHDRGPPVHIVRLSENRGRGAALNAGFEATRGEIVVFCDSDIVPDEGFVDDHAAFHAERTDALATHLGALEWGIDPGPLGELLGARASPRLAGATGPVDFTHWFTDNWSFKRDLLARGPRFDEGFRAWGWEEIELAWRLQSLGATNELTRTAVGRHLKPVDLEGRLRSFERSVPNLLRLARSVGPVPGVRELLSFRLSSPELLRACDRLVHRVVAHVELLWPRLRRAPPSALSRKLAEDVANSIVRLGIERGFAALPDEAMRGEALPVQDPEEGALRYADLLATVLLAERAMGDAPASEAFALDVLRALAPLGGGRLARAFASRIDWHVDAQRRACA